MKQKILYFSLLFLLIGCSSSEDEQLQEYIKQVKARPKKPIEPIPEIKPLPIFVFPEQDTRESPFKQHFETPESVSDNNSPDILRKKQFLETMSLDSLKFVGTLKEGGQYWALILQPNGRISHVTVGHYMGKNYGKIILIQDSRLRLEENFKINGKWTNKITTIDLQK